MIERRLPHETPEAARPEELVKIFDWEKVPREDICLPEKLFE